MSSVSVVDLSKLNMTLSLSMWKANDKEACWEWVGDTKNGFGQTVVGGIVKSAYHYAFECFKGKIPDNTIPVHKCGNDLCCNPYHLDLKEILLPEGNWRPAPDLPKHFMVSDKGELFSIRSEKVMRQNLFANKYLGIVTRINGKHGKCRTLRAHVQVAKAFIPNPYAKPHINHISAIKTSNGVDNLEWVTRQENMDHASELGLMKDKKKAKDLKLSLEQMQEILLLTELSARKIAKRYNVSRAVIDKLRRNPKRYLEIAQRI